MRTNTQEAVLSAYILSIGKRTPRDAAQDAAELCRLATSLGRLNEIACNDGLTEQQERRKQNLQTRIKVVLEQAGLVLNHFNSDPRGYAVYRDLADGSYDSFGGREGANGRAPQPCRVVGFRLRTAEVLRAGAKKTRRAELLPPVQSDERV